VVRLAPGGRACLFSSGLVEARVNGSEMGREGVGAIMGELGADLTAESLLEAVADRARAVSSDMAACVLEPDQEAVAAETAAVAAEG
jgi:hypothetical protein